MDIGLLILRVVVGGLLMGHGLQKLFGWFGGGGLAGSGGFLESLGFRSGRTWAIVNGLAETGGGLLLVLGLLTPLGAAVIIGTMAVASVAAHWKNGIWNTKGGYELPLTNMAAAAALAFVGPGAYSADAALELGWSGTWYGLGAVALGLVAAALVLAARRRATPVQSGQPDAGEAA
jgi:putative oxidoreductase